MQQARYDPINGQQDIQAFRLIFFGLGLAVGGVVSAFADEYYTPYHVFFFNFLVMVAITILSSFLGIELETNKYAKMIDKSEQEYYKKFAANLALVGDEMPLEVPKVPFFQGVSMRWQTMKQGVRVPLVKKFYTFLIIQGFMPDFQDFTYYFALDVLHITKFTIGLSTLISGAAVFFGPIAFQRFCRNT